MKSFVRIAALVLIAAAGMAVYETYLGEPVSFAPQETIRKTVQRVPLSKSPPHRVRTVRTLDLASPRPSQSYHLAEMIKAGGGSDFPILMPPSMTMDPGTAENYNVRLKLLENGYSAVISTPDMDITLYGTSSVFRRQKDFEREIQEIERDIKSKLAGAGTEMPKTSPDGTTSRANKPSDEIVPRLRPNYDKRFEEADDGQGGMISFGRYGADYHVEFYCHRRDEKNCIDENKALAFLALLEGGRYDQ
jgi:hypothetical protein